MWGIINLTIMFKEMYDKENALTFQTLTQTMKLKKAKKSRHCYYHQDRTAKYRSTNSDIFYCVSCAVKEVSRGVKIEDIDKS